jgi:hypothetical protein
MSGYLLGGGLIALGLVFFFIGRRSGGGKSISANRGSIAIGGSSYGPVTNIQSVSQKATERSGEHWITVVAIITELVGIGITIWHAYHLATAR